MRAQVRRGSLAAVALVSSITACTLVVDTDGLSTGTLDGGEGDGPTDARGEGGSSEDAFVPVDGPGPADATPGDAADAAFTCAGETVCEDFEGAQIRGAWTVSESSGGLLALDTVRARGGSRSLHLVRAASSPNASAYLSLALGAKYELDCSLDVWVSALQPSEQLQFLTITHDVADTSYRNYESVYAVVQANKVLFGQYRQFAAGGDMKDELSFLIANATGQWLNVVVRLRSAEAEMVVTTESGVSSSKTNPLSSPVRTGTRIRIGVPYASGTSKIDTHVDNVRCVVK